MGYYNRKRLTINTLNKFNKMYSNRNDFEVIIVDDCSKKEEQLYDVIKNYNFPIKYEFITKEEKGNRINPGYTYNKGFSLAKGEIIIVQNPECYHVTNILEHVEKNLKENEYYSYACYSTYNDKTTNYLIQQDYISKNNILKNINNWQKMGLNKYIPFNMLDKFPGCWYQHPKYRRKGYHFCGALFKNKLQLSGGFEKLLYNGFAFDDDVFLLAIQYKAKLKIKHIDHYDGLVIHQFHGFSHNKLYGTKIWLRNKIIFNLIKKNCIEKNIYALK